MQIFFSCRSPFQAQRRSLVAAMILAAVPYLSGTALAAEFYQDRIFRQKYELPDNVNVGALPDIVGGMLLSMAFGGGFNPATSDPFSDLIEVMGGQCDHSFVSSKSKYVPQSEAQVAIAQKAQASTQSTPSVAEGESIKCGAQTLLFLRATMDQHVSDEQLADLATRTRVRFARNWLTFEETRRADMRLAADRYANVTGRLDRLRRAGLGSPSNLPGWLEGGHVKEALGALGRGHAYEQLDQQLTAFEVESYAIIWRQEAEPPSTPQTSIFDAPPAQQESRPAAREPAAAMPPPANSCTDGGICVAAEKTVFCRTPPQLTAILSQRPGPDRRRVLDAFKASGDCALVEAGQRLHWRGAMVTIMPRGEPAADLIPVVSAGGRTGYVLRNAMAADSAAAQ